MPAKTLSEKGLEQPIKRVVRHRDSRQYFSGSGWTEKLEEATSFVDSLEAASICAKHDLKDVELALRYDRSPGDVFCLTLR